LLKRSPEELEALLQEQYRFLRISANGYDHGDRFESKRIAVVLRTLFHSKGTSKSLVDQIGLAGSTFYSSIDMGASVEVPAGLWGIDETASTYEAITTDPQYSTNFATWWSSPVYRVGDDSFSRERFVLHSANRDGGAHVDPANAALSPSMGTGTFFRPALNSAGGKIIITSDPIELAMRTIAGEVHATFRELDYS
jgi:hypothetical protein